MGLFLKNKNFRYLWLSSTFAGASSNIVQYALSLYVLDLTQSASAFAAVLSIVIFPRLILSPIAGVWGDRVNRKVALIWTSLADILVLALAGLIAFGQGSLSVLAIYLLVIAMEMVEVLQSGPMSSVLPAIVSSDELALANTWMRVDDGIVAVVTPFIAALIYTQFSIAGSLLAGAAILFLTMLGYTLMKIPMRKEAVEQYASKDIVKNYIADFIEGIKVGLEIPHMLSLGIAALLVNLLLAPSFGVVATSFLRIDLGVSNAEFSLIESFMAVIGIVAPLIALRFMKEVKNPFGLLLNHILKMVAGIAIVFVGTVLFELQITSRLVTIGFMLLGFIVIQIVVTYVNVGISTLFGQIVPEKYMGRIGASLGVLSTISSPMGQFLFGHLLEWSNASVCLAVSMIGMVTFVLFSGKIKSQTQPLEG